MIVGTAGHIDHGKTALVKALTGIDADRLQEEKARGITIDLGYAYTPLASGEILGFVDVPGHERFIHNMLAGATGIDFALLVIAADDGVMPQTVEHLQILDLLGITRGAVALTKIDRVAAERIAEVQATIETLLQTTGLAGSPVFPVSAISGTGIPALRAFLESAAAECATRPSSGGFRLAVDRCFTVAGSGTVVTGTVFSGRVRVGDRLMLGPAGKPVRVRGLHAQNHPAEFGRTGQRCALNLADIGKDEIERGDWVLAPHLNRPTIRLDVHLKLLGSEANPLKHWTPVHVYLGAFHATAHVALLRDEPLLPGESATAQLVLDRPTCAVNGDRCVLRDASAQRNLAGARVLDPQAPARGRRRPERLAMLAAWAQSGSAAQLQTLLDASPDGLNLDDFAATANISLEEIDSLLAGAQAHRVESLPPMAFSPHHWSRLKQAVTDALAKEHGEVPDSLGLNSEQLRLRTAPRLPRPVFAAVLNELMDAQSLARDGSWWHLPGHGITLAPEDEKLWERIAPLLSAQPFQPPRVRDIARAESLDEGAVRKLLMRTARMGLTYKVAHDHYFERAAVADLAHIVRDIAGHQSDGLVLAAEFRDCIGTGRKLAIHILEFFDRVGLTRRIKDSHRIRNASLEF